MIDDTESTPASEPNEPVAPAAANEPLETTSTEELAPGFHVLDASGDYNSGPYETETDAQAFIDQHLEGHGSVKAV